MLYDHEHEDGCYYCGWNEALWEIQRFIKKKNIDNEPILNQIDYLMYHEKE